MKKLFAIIPFLIIFWGCPQMEYDLDKESPYVTSATFGTSLSLRRTDNISFENFAEQNKGISRDGELFIRFSEPMYLNSLFQYGESETIVLVKEENFTRTLFNGIENPPLSDSNYAKIEKGLLFEKSGNFDDYIKVSFKDGKTLDANTKYALIISKSVVDMNGKALGVEYIENNETILKNENLIVFFETAQ